jgi:hypothetical protein
MRLSREGKIRSAMEVVMRTTPHAHRIITWGSDIVHGRAQLDSEPHQLSLRVGKRPAEIVRGLVQLGKRRAVTSPNGASRTL